MKWIACSAFLILLFLKADAQPNPGGAGSLDIHVVPLTLFDRNPRLRVGMEYQGHHKLGYNIDIGIGNSWLNKGRLRNTPFGEDYSFFELRTELKWYPIERAGFENYWGGELFYQIMDDRILENYFFPENSPFTMFFSEARFKKQKLGVLLKGGTKFIFADGIILDFYLGMGIAYRNIAYSEIINPSPSTEEPFGEWFTPPYRNEGNRFMFHPTFGIKAGFIVFKNE